MLLALLILASVAVLLLLVLLLRGPAQASPQLTQAISELSAMPARLESRLEAIERRSDALDQQVRASMLDLNATLTGQLASSRQSSEGSSSSLREEVQRTLGSLGSALTRGLGDFRTDNKQSDEQLRQSVVQQLEGLRQHLSAFTADATRSQIEGRDALHARLVELSAANAQSLEQVRATVEQRLEKLNTENTAKLEEMRHTVDEKLHATLQTRLTESFGQVTNHLGEVQRGLGEMKELATGVGDLKKVLSNVKTRGVVGEFQLGMQLEQMFSPEQYIKNARIRPGTTESVEYALKLPDGEQGYTLMPIDAKFPREDWERLEHAYEYGSPEEVQAAGKAFERSIRMEGRRICDKYIDPPTTTPHAVMFLPTENLYAEVVRRPGLQAEIQSQCRVTIAGPSTFMAILTSFQMGFHTLAIQKKGDEVWKVLSRAKKEFDTFGGLMQKVEDQVGTVQNTIQKLGVRTRAINRALKDVSSFDEPMALTASADEAPLALEPAAEEQEQSLERLWGLPDQD